MMWLTSTVTHFLMDVSQGTSPNFSKDWCTSEVMSPSLCAANISHLNCATEQHGVLRKLKHIFPNTYQRINSICSPAKVGLVVTDFNYQPGS